MPHAGDGEVGFDELWEWVEGRAHALDKRIDRKASRAKNLVVTVNT